MSEQVLSERPWPENAWPTAGQFVDWFLEQTAEKQDEVAKRMLDDARTAARCFSEAHDQVEAIIAARLAPIEALADEWDATRAAYHDSPDNPALRMCAAELRAALTAVRANLPVVDGADRGGDRG